MSQLDNNISTQHEMLDNITHQDIKIITDLHPDYGELQSYTTLIPSELEAAQTEFPIFLRKNSQTNKFELIALFGMAESENLFLTKDGWQAHYVPLSIKRKPFLIGFQNQQGQQTPVVFIDMQSPRISQTEGESVFMPHGGQSGYLQEVSSILLALHEGHQQTDIFIEALEQLALIEPVNLSISLNSGQKISLGELYTINQDVLAALNAEQIGQLHSQGMLKDIYMIIASLGNLTRLIERKNSAL